MEGLTELPKVKNTLAIQESMNNNLKEKTHKVQQQLRQEELTEASLTRKLHELQRVIEQLEGVRDRAKEDHAAVLREHQRLRAVDQICYARRPEKSSHQRELLLKHATSQWPGSLRGYRKD